MADEAIESKADDGMQGTELMGRPLRINKAELEVLEGLVEVEEVANGSGYGGSSYGGNNGGGCGGSSYGGNNGGYGSSSYGGNNGGGYGGSYGGNNSGGYGGGGSYGGIMAAMEVIMVAMAAVILKLILLTIIKLPEQKVGKIEAMEIPQKTQNSKVAEAGGKEEFQMRVIFQMKRINNSYLLI